MPIHAHTPNVCCICHTYRFMCGLYVFDNQFHERHRSIPIQTDKCNTFALHFCSRCVCLSLLFIRLFVYIPIHISILSFSLSLSLLSGVCVCTCVLLWWIHISDSPKQIVCNYFQIQKHSQIKWISSNGKRQPKHTQNIHVKHCVIIMVESSSFRFIHSSLCFFVSFIRYTKHGKSARDSESKRVHTYTMNLRVG